MRWPVVAAIFGLGVMTYFFCRPTLTLEVSATDVVYPADLVTIRCEGAPFTVVLRVNPDETIDVIDGRADDFAIDTICPITHRTGVTSFVALGFQKPVDARSPNWQRRLLDLEDARDGTQWKAVFQARRVCVQDFPTHIEMRPLDKENIHGVLPVYVRLARDRMRNGDVASLSAIANHIIAATTEPNLKLEHEDAMSLSWLLIGGSKFDLALDVLEAAISENDEQQAFQVALQALSFLSLDRYVEACEILERARGLSTSQELQEHVLGLCCIAQLALGRPDEVVEQLDPLFGGYGHNFSSEEGLDLLLRQYLLALEELGEQNTIRKIVGIHNERSASFSWLVLSGRHRDAATMAREAWDKNPTLNAQPLGLSFHVSGVSRPETRWRPSSVGFLNAHTDILRANFLVQQWRPAEARRLLEPAISFFAKIGYRGVRYADAKLCLANCALFDDLDQATRLTKEAIERERSARFSHPFRQSEAEWLHALVLAAQGSADCKTHLDQAIELASQTDLLDSGALMAQAHYLASYFEDSAEAKQRRLDEGLEIAAREMVRWDRPRATANGSLMLLWHYLSKSERSPEETYQRVRPFAARTLEGNEPWQRADAALVDIFFYYRTDEHFALPRTERHPQYVAFVKYRDNIARIELGASEPIDEAVRKWREKLSNRQDPQAAAQGVRQLLWQPLAAQVPDEIETLYISGDWELAAVPWEAIPLAAESHREQVVDRWHIERLAASRSKRLTDGLQLAVGKELGLAPNTQQVTAAKPALETTTSPRWLLVGDVDFGAEPKGPPQSQRTFGNAASPRLPWQPLQGTAREIELIQAGAGNRKCDVLRGSEATKEAVMRLVPDAEIVHFATHAFANATWHALSPVQTGGVLDHFGLALTGANHSSIDGLLTATEVGRLKMPHLKLAVLSGCETGIGRPVRDQYFSTLHRAFHRAGAPQVLASLFRVDDDAAQQMMTRFYKHYVPGKSASLALREAQLEIRGGRVKTGDIASRGPDFSKGPQPMSENPSTRRSPDWVWAAWYVSSVSLPDHPRSAKHAAKHKPPSKTSR